ncbi:MAG: hypothetical protein AAFN77_16080 [Planctomycetota bacterium]
MNAETTDDLDAKSNPRKLTVPRRFFSFTIKQMLVLATVTTVVIFCFVPATVVEVESKGATPPFPGTRVNLISIRDAGRFEHPVVLIKGVVVEQAFVYGATNRYRVRIRLPGAQRCWLWFSVRPKETIFIEDFPVSTASR